MNVTAETVVGMQQVQLSERIALGAVKQQLAGQAVVAQVVAQAAQQEAAVVRAAAAPHRGQVVDIVA